MYILFLLFVLVPLLELAVLVQMGRLVGLLPTLALVLLTGFLGAYLARHQGLGVLGRIRAELAAGKMPAEALLDGLLILVAGAVLLTPGLLTDLFGFLCLIPATRRILRKALWTKLESMVMRNRVQVVRTEGGAEVIDVEPVSRRPES